MHYPPIANQARCNDADALGEISTVVSMSDPRSRSATTANEKESNHSNL